MSVGSGVRILREKTQCARRDRNRPGGYGCRVALCDNAIHATPFRSCAPARRPAQSEAASRHGVSPWPPSPRTADGAAVVLLIGGLVALGTGSVLINRQRTRAEANFRLAREAVDDMYTQVAERWLSEQAQLEPLQREFLVKAAQTPRNPGLRHDLAGELEELANLLCYRGRIEEADPILRRADSLSEVLATDFPSVVEYQNARASIRRDLANLLQDRGRLADGEPAYSRAIEVGRALAVAHPEVVEIRSLLAGALAQAGDLLQVLHRPGDAERAFQSATELAERLAAEFSDVPGFANAADISLSGLAQLALDRGELARARHFQEQLIRHARTALGSNRRNATYRGTVLHGYGLLAGLQVREGDHRGSEGSARAMEALAESPVDF